MTTTTRPEPTVRSPVVASLLVVAGAAASFGVVLACVTLHVTDHLDVVARDAFRPHDEWSRPQVLADRLVTVLHPVVVGAVMLLMSLRIAQIRRSWRPPFFVLAVSAAGAVLVELAKVMLRRPDPHGDLSSLSSFPSGHMAGLIVTTGAAALLVDRTDGTWWRWGGIGLLSTLMACALLVDATHWLTDILGGSLLGVAVLGVAAWLRPRVLGGFSGRPRPGGSLP